MKKKCYKCGGTAKKYEIGGNTLNKKNPLEDIPTPEQFTQDQGQPSNKANTLDFNPNYGAPSTFGNPVDNSNLLPFSKMENTGDLTYHPLFKLFNILAQATTGLANQATNAGIDKRERLQTIKSFQNPDYSTANQDGLDKSPIYAKYGIHIKPSHKGKFTAWAKAHGMSVEEAAHHVMANQKDYSHEVIAMANFAKNAEGFSHKAGGKHHRVKDTDMDKDTMMDMDHDMMKNGGNWIKGAVNPAHKGYCTPMTKSTCTPRRKAFAETMKKHHGFHQTGGYVDPNTMKEWNNFIDFAKQKGIAGSPELDIRNKNLGKQTLNEYLQQNPNSTLSYDLVPKIQQELQTYRQQVINDVKANKRAFGTGVTENNFMPGLSKVDGWLGSKTSSYKFPEAYMNIKTPQETKTQDLGLAATASFQAGGEDNPQDEKLDQEVAAMLQQGASPQDVIQKLVQSGIPQAQATQVVQEVMQQLQGQQQEGQPQQQQQQQPQQQAGGDDTPQDDNDGQSAELEEGENYQTPQGDINKVPEGAGTHEDGGVVVPNVSKVLEDTSDKRKDKASKLLKIAPKQVESMLGFKPKTALSHSKAHEKAIEFYNKKSKAITNQIKKNVDARDENGNDSYALNSMKFNVNTLSQLPSEKDMFNTLFDHQEGVKSLFGIQDNGKKAQYGLKPVLNNDADPIRSYGYNKNIPVKAQAGLNAYSGDKSFSGNASKYSTAQWDAMANDLGFKGSGDRAFQQFLFNQNGDVGTQDLQSGIIGLHDKFGNPNTPPSTNSPMNWFDNRLGHRWDSAYEQWQNSKTQPDVTSNNGTAEDYADNPNIIGSSITQPNNGVTNLTNTRYTTTKSNNAFNKPLQWYDVAGPLQALLGATKAPINYNPATVKQIQLRGVNPLPTLEQGQSDFNAELNALASTGVNGGVQFANAGNLYARKYALNNQVLGNAENTNAQIKNQETEYNANAADRQSLIDQAARADFERKNLATDEAVRQQKLTALDSLYTRIAQNKKFNLEGNLLMKLFPNFNPQGDFNGRQYQFRNPLNTGTSSGNLDLNSMLESSGIDPASLSNKDRAKYIVQLGKYNAKRQLLLNKR